MAQLNSLHSTQYSSAGEAQIGHKTEAEDGNSIRQLYYISNSFSIDYIKNEDILIQQEPYLKKRSPTISNNDITHYKDANLHL